MKVLGIDSSLTGAAFVVLDNGEIAASVRVESDEGVKGHARRKKIVDALVAILDQHEPDVIVMENYAFGANTNNITKLGELGGLIKWAIFERGYATGRDAILRGDKVFFVQTRGQMTKFCLASGAIKKDSRYLLEVFERIKRSFKNDDEADAYMHAWTASIVVGVIRGKIEVANLTSYQQESLLDRGLKRRKGVSKTKALKLPEAEKQRIIQEMEVEGDE